MRDEEIEGAIMKARADPLHPRCRECLTTGYTAGEYKGGNLISMVEQCTACGGTGKELTSEQIEYLKKNPDRSKAVLDLLKDTNEYVLSATTTIEKKKQEATMAVFNAGKSAFDTVSSWLP